MILYSIFVYLAVSVKCFLTISKPSKMAAWNAFLRWVNDTAKYFFYFYVAPIVYNISSCEIRFLPPSVCPVLFYSTCPISQHVHTFSFKWDVFCSFLFTSKLTLKPTLHILSHNSLPSHIATPYFPARAGGECTEGGITIRSETVSSSHDHLSRRRITQLRTNGRVFVTQGL